MNRDIYKIWENYEGSLHKFKVGDLVRPNQRWVNLIDEIYGPLEVKPNPKEILLVIKKINHLMHDTTIIKGKHILDKFDESSDGWSARFFELATDIPPKIGDLVNI